MVPKFQFNFDALILELALTRQRQTISAKGFSQGSLLGLTLTHIEVKNVRLCSES